jgi:hypothetical protein
MLRASGYGVASPWNSARADGSLTFRRSKPSSPTIAGKLHALEL